MWRRQLASDVRALDVLADTPAIVDIARVAGRSIPEAAHAFLAVGDRFGIDDLIGRMAHIKVADDYDRLAIAGAEGTLADARHSMTLAVLGASGVGGRGWKPGPRASRIACNRQSRRLPQSWPHRSLRYRA